MLTIESGHPRLNCNGRSRRDFIRAGTLGLGGLALSDLLRLKAHAASSGSAVKQKSVVLLFLAGWPSQYECFDPRMSAASEIRSMTGEVSTSLPGLTFGGTFERLSRFADRMAIVNSFVSTTTDHRRAAVDILAGHDGGTNNPLKDAAIGAQYAKLRGTSHPRTGIPTYSMLPVREVDEPFVNFHVLSGVLGCSPGSLGDAYAPFDPSGGSTAVENMTLNMPADRLGERRLLLKQLDRINRQVDSDGSLVSFDQFEQQAFDVITGKAAQVLDLSNENPRTVAMYDTSEFKFDHHLKPTKVGSSPLGRQMLLARRLCEAGCGFVTVVSGGWDMHADANNRGMVDGMRVMGRPVDKAVSAFLQDVEDRGLSDEILLVITGEFGRTPRINKNGGRNHWAGICPLAFVGGGLNMGQVIGRSSRDGGTPVSDPIRPSRLMATIMHTLFDIGKLRTMPTVPRDLARRLESVRPIEELF